MKKRLKRVGAIALSAMMLMGMAVPAMAGGEETNEESSKVEIFNKTLDMSEAQDSSVPDVAFEFEVKPKEMKEGEKFKNIPVYTGKEGKITASVEFSSGDEKKEDNKVTKSVKVEGINDIEFDKPGIYRYSVTEKKLDDNSIWSKNITCDTSEHILDVYVEDKGDKEQDLKPTHYVMSSGNPTIENEKIHYENKVEGIINKYSCSSTDSKESTDMKISKVVKGAMGDKNKKFDFDLEFSVPEDLKDADLSKIKVNIMKSENAEVLKGEKTVDTTISLEEINETTIKLAHNDYITIKGVPVGINLSVKENDYSNDGYTTTINVNGEETKTAEITIAKKDGGNEIVYTNTNAATIPTGLVMNVMPYILMVVAAAGGFVFFMKRRKSEDE